MAKIVQVPPTEIAKVKQQLESERIQLAKQRREIQAAQNRSAAIKQGIGVAVSLGTGALALYKIAQKQQLEKERRDLELLNIHSKEKMAERRDQILMEQLKQAAAKREKPDWIKDTKNTALTTIAVATGLEKGAKVAYPFAPDAFKDWWEETQADQSRRKAYFTESTKMEADAKQFKSFYEDMQSIVDYVYATQTDPGKAAHFPTEIKDLSNLDTGNPNIPIGPWLLKKVGRYTKTGGSQEDKYVFPNQPEHLQRYLPGVMSHPAEDDPSFDRRYDMKWHPDGYYEVTPKPLNMDAVYRMGARGQAAASKLTDPKLLATLAALYLKNKAGGQPRAAQR